jgi:tRNA threonylcarbamoyladenosine biosynthesis protein TsaE
MIMQKEFKNIKEKDLEFIAKEVFDFAEKFFIEQNENSNKAKNICVIFLNGDLGAGKTTFTKYFAKVLGIIENVISPTFILRKDYEFNIKDKEYILIHIDGYRFDKPEESKVLNLDFEMDVDKNKLKVVKKIILIE